MAAEKRTAAELVELYAKDDVKSNPKLKDRLTRATHIAQHIAGDDFSEDDAYFFIRGYVWGWTEKS